MKDVTSHIKSLLSTSTYVLSPDDKTFIAKRGLEEWILGKLLSKKFRKTKADPACIERTKKAIHLSVSQSKPLPVYFFQGAYKLWRLPSSPEPDWAEFFNISYLLEYVAPIAAAYEPGVELVYYLHTLLMEAHDNLETSEVDAYLKGIKRLIDVFGEKTPPNITIKMLKDADMYPRNEYFKALEEGLVDAHATFESFDKSKKQDLIRRSKLNIKWKGKERWDLLSDKEKAEKIKKSALYEIAASQNLPRVMKKVKADKNVLVFTQGNPMMIGIGSTKTSVAKYWVGYGVLEKDNKGFYERVLSPSQYEKIKDRAHEKVPVNLFNMNNFQNILIYPRLKF